MKGYYKGELRPCECGGIARIEDRSKNNRGHKGVEYGRIVCEHNSWSNFKNRCFHKTICGPLHLVIKSWNARPAFDKAIDALILVLQHIPDVGVAFKNQKLELKNLTGLEYAEALEIYKQRQEEK